MDGRFPPPRGSTGFMSRMPSNLRPGIVVVAVLGLFWSLASGVSSFRNVPFFNSNNESKLGVFYIVLGCLCMVIMAIEIFGIFAVVSRRVQAVRLYAFLSILVTLLILTIYIIQAVVHSKFKNDIINICTNVNQGDHIFFTGFFGPVDGGIVTPLQAQQWCNQEFNHYTVSNIVALLVVTAIAAIFALFVFAYLHQLRNQTSPATFPMEAYQNNQAYNAYNPTPAYKPTYNPYSTQPYNPTYNNERSSETLHVPEDAFDHDKPPIYEGEGRIDRKEKDYDSQ